jgi:threonine/homoserine/homoserine lactone efflux protein
MITFALAIVLMLATPGPGVLSAAGVGAGFGAAAGLRYVAGLCIGQALVYAAVAAGLSAFVLDTPWLRLTLMAAVVSISAVFGKPDRFCRRASGFH